MKNVFSINVNGVSDVVVFQRGTNLVETHKTELKNPYSERDKMLYYNISALSCLTETLLFRMYCRLHMNAFKTTTNYYY